MIISIVTGTYNRRASLARMIDSARQQISVGIDHEFVIVDGGSTDGTQDWCGLQPDVVLIEQGELRGAIAAFCDGAKAAQGEYVLLANDDITFEPGSIVPALVKLEQHSDVGAVAFHDNRPAPGYEGQGYKVQTMPVMMHGKQEDWPYAQVGMFNRQIGNRAGWWGADDPDFPGHTYGGDNYLSARLYEMGYAIATPEECRITDHVEADSLREHNYTVEQKNPRAYYQRYPTPPIYEAEGMASKAHGERLRFLYLPLYEPTYGQYKHGLREALQRVGLVWEVDYQNEPYDLSDIVRQFQPHILLMQCHSPDDVPADKLAQARALNPGMLVVNWNGDVYEDMLTSDRMLQYLKHVDLQLTVNADVLPVYAEHGIQAAYWQVGFEPVDYDHLPRVLSHDIVFLANAYSASRQALGTTLRSLRYDVGLYGRNWPFGNGDTTYQFAASAALVQQAQIVIGDNQYGQRGFVSNRIFETLAAGGFLLHQAVPGLEDLTGLQDGVHYVAWVDLDDLQDKIRHYMHKSRVTKRREIADAGRTFTHSHHSFDARVKQLLLEIVPELEFTHALDPA